jgi:hypothetical protein
MDLADKLQIKPGTEVIVVAAPADGPDLSGLGPKAGDPAAAGAIIAFVRQAADLTDRVTAAVIEAARQDKLAWIAYPKAGKLGTDLNRDSLAQVVTELGIRPVRQISLDDVWSALRMRPI